MSSGAGFPGPECEQRDALQQHARGYEGVCAAPAGPAGDRVLQEADEEWIDAEQEAPRRERVARLLALAH
jgi:hypothetical protein